MNSGIHCFGFYRSRSTLHSKAKSFTMQRMNQGINFFLALLLLSGCGCYIPTPSPSPTSEAEQLKAIDDIQRSHIEGNVPAESEFDQLLRRDLAKYLESKLGEKLQVEFELLRKGPTQSGVSFPKYYLWVKGFEGDKKVIEGAVRVAAIDRKEFSVTDFCTPQDLRADPDLASRVFPAALVPGIKKRLKSISP